MQSSIVRLAKSVLPKPLKDFLRKKWDALRISYQSWRNPQRDLVPPQNLIFVGYGDFIKIGEEFAGYFIEMGMLKPNEKVLDVGCGIGRMALPLTKYMNRRGEYWGFDIVKEGIDWCTERYTPRFPNFHFLFSNVYNQHYNPGGKQRGSEYVFPFTDG
jgi:SAM-dependent methyltransferase